jgi:hypothetical protein
MCTLTAGVPYRASVVATSGALRTTASNDKFRFNVGAIVWGQPDGKSNEGARLGLAMPEDSIIVGTKLVVADQNNSRVLIWNTIPASNYKAADIVLGQPDLTTTSANYGGIGPSTFNGTNGVASDGTHLIVADRLNHRVLIWNTFPTTNKQPADVVLGQPDFGTATANTGGISGHSMTEPFVWVGGGKLFVSDRNNHRVLVWNAIPTQNQADADLVLGQPDKGSNTDNNGGLDEKAISDPGRGWVDGTRLLLPDAANHRVLIWNTMPTTDNAAAEVVLGQSSMSLNSPNAGGTVGLAGLDGPLAVYASGSTIAVADTNNNRVAVWTSAITTNGQPANLILGQTSTTGNASNAGGVSASSAFNPCSIAGDGTNLIVTDQSNHRVLIYPTVPTMTGAPASFVVGQPDMVSNRANNGGVSASTFSSPAAISMVGTKFAIADSSAARVLLWNTPPTTRSDLPNLVLGQPNFTSSGQFGGTTTASSLCAPGAVQSDGTRLFVGEPCAHRVTVWSSLPTLTQQPADIVLGQPDMKTSTANTNGLSGSSLFGLSAPYSDGAHLFVADKGNHRVLMWNTIPTMNTKAADLVLGQPNVNANTQNNGGVSAISLASPAYVLAAGGRLFVADTGNNRVLIWNAIPTVDRAPADVVLGQANMMTGTVTNPASSRTLTGPTSIYVDGSGRLYVADSGSNRILYWTTIPTQNQAPADGVIGQPNMDVGVANNGGLSARTLQRPAGVLALPSPADGGGSPLLYVVDSGNDRLLLMPRP